MATTWFILLAGMLTTYAILDGFDLGVGTIYRYVSRTDDENRVCLNAIGPLWSGNEVWLIAGGGSLFFSFPRVYAGGFSGFYLALMLVLWLLIARGISLEFRGQIANPLWRSFWDAGLTIGSALLSLLLGVALGNLVHGLPLDGHGLFQGSFGLLIGPYSLLVGVFSLVLLSLHGANYLCVKSEGPVHDRARGLSRPLSWLVLLLVVGTSVATWGQRPDLATHFGARPYLLVLPALLIVFLISTLLFVRRGQDREAFLSGAGLIAALLGCAAAAIYPDLLRSTVDPRFSLGVDNTSAAPESLRLGLALIGSALVVVAFCQIYVYRQFRGKVRVEPGHGY